MRTLGIIAFGLATAVCVYDGVQVMVTGESEPLVNQVVDNFCLAVLFGLSFMERLGGRK
jgi:hypothetical protein